MKMPEMVNSHPISAETTASPLHRFSPDGTIRLPEGIPGFPALRQAAFFSEATIEPFFHMQALNIKDLSFICIEPFVVCPEYLVDIPDAFAKRLDLQSPSDAWIFCLVTLAPQREDITANLMCPVVVNVRNMQARQLIIEDAEHLLRYRIWHHLGEDNLEEEMQAVG